MICMDLVKETRIPKVIDYLKALVTTHPFTPKMKAELISKTGTTDEYEFYLSLLEYSYRQAATIMPVPVDTLLSLHNTFRNNDYKHEWLFWKHNIKEFGLHVELKCHFTATEYGLEIEAYDLKNNNPVVKGIVYKTGPDRIFFDKDIKKVRINEGKIEILDFLGFPRIDINLDILAEGELIVRYNDDPRFINESWYTPIANKIESQQTLIDRIQSFGK